MYAFLKRFHRDEKGAIAIIVAASLLMLFGFAALAIDLGHGYFTRTVLQVTASAAALAGVLEVTDANNDGVDDTDEYRRKAVEFVYRNMTASNHGNIVAAACGTYNPGSGTVTGDSECSDIKAGDWDPVSRTFTAWDDAGFNLATMDLDAVRVRTHRSQANGNPLPTYIAPAIGHDQLNIITVAVAWADDSPLDCYQRGIIAEGWVDMDSNNTYTDAICVYGEIGVKYQSNNCFQGPNEGCGQGTNDPGVKVMTPPPPNWDAQGGPNPGMDDAKRIGYEEPVLAQQVGDFIDAAEAGFAFASWNAPGFDYGEFADPNIGNAPVTTMPSDQLIAGTIYDISGTADIPKGDWQDVAIKADVIKLQSDSSLTNAILMAETEIVIDGDVDHAVLASRDLIKLGSDIQIGGVACDPDGISVAIYSLGKFTIQSNSVIRNAHLITGYDVEPFDLQSNNTYEGVTMQAMGDIDLGSNNTISGCPPGTGKGPLGNNAGKYVRLVD